MEKITKIKIILGIFVILIGLTTFLIVYFSQPEPITDLDSCKMKYWKDCDLEVNEDMCYRVNGLNTTKWSHCQNITSEQEECWIMGIALCDSLYD